MVHRFPSYQKINTLYTVNISLTEVVGGRGKEEEKQKENYRKKRRRRREYQHRARGKLNMMR